MVIFFSYPVIHFLAIISDKAHAHPAEQLCCASRQLLHSFLHSHSVPVPVQLLSRVLLFVTPWTAARQAPPSSSISQSLLRFTSVVSVMLSNHLILSYPLLTLPSVLPSIRAFSSESFLATGDQSIGASTSVLPMNIQGLFPSGVIGLISLQSLGLSRVFFSNYSSKALILLRSAFFMVQRSDPYMTTRKTIALTI